MDVELTLKNQLPWYHNIDNVSILCIHFHAMFALFIIISMYRIILRCRVVNKYTYIHTENIFKLQIFNINEYWYFVLYCIACLLIVR